MHKGEAMLILFNELKSALAPAAPASGSVLSKGEQKPRIPVRIVIEKCISLKSLSKSSHWGKVSLHGSLMFLNEVLGLLHTLTSGFERNRRLILRKRSQNNLRL
jgi:hypothetical protein